jgi:hypothetical protein
MSRIGKRPISIPSGVDVQIDGNTPTSGSSTRPLTGTRVANWSSGWYWKTCVTPSTMTSQAADNRS